MGAPGSLLGKQVRVTLDRQNEQVQCVHRIAMRPGWFQSRPAGYLVALNGLFCTVSCKAARASSHLAAMLRFLPTESSNDLMLLF